MIERLQRQLFREAADAFHFDAVELMVEWIPMYGVTLLKK